MALHGAFDLAARQIEIDRAIIGDEPALWARKLKKLGQSPLGFFRGSAPLFYEILADDPSLQLVTGDIGHVVGDMHLENVGAYRTDADEVTFDLNDFDDAGVAPLWVDRLRVAVSVLLAARSFHASAGDALGLVRELLQAYDDALAGAPPPPLPKPIIELVERARKRSRKALLDMRAPLVKGERAFLRGDRYLELSTEQRSQVPALIEGYRAALGERAPSHASSWVLVDVASRVAGCGSLGRKRFAFIVKDAEGTERMFELKEAVPSAVERLTGKADAEPSARVVRAANALALSAPRQLAALGVTPLGSFIGRKLCPEEDKLDLAKLSVGPKLSNVVRVVGALLGHGHARDVAAAGAKRVIVRDNEDVIDRAVVLAGSFESIYLAHSRIVSR
ncbi:MAG: DUF2252 family protein [Myxococcales bacterium]|nr:DUF2252 family protein [Myxococcales bacterium]